jgi:hypothetical protein
MHQLNETYCKYQVTKPLNNHQYKKKKTKGHKKALLHKVSEDEPLLRSLYTLAKQRCESFGEWPSCAKASEGKGSVHRSP